MDKITFTYIGINKPFKLDNGEIYTHNSLTKGDKIGATGLSNQQYFFNRNIKVTTINNPRDDHYK